MRPVILVLESNAPVWRQWKQEVESCGVEVLESAGVTDLTPRIGLRRPRLIIVSALDYSPEKVLNAALHIRQTNRDVPIILLVRSGSEELAIAALRDGIDDYFHMPGEIKALQEAIRRLTAASSPVAISDLNLDLPFVAASPPMQSVKSQLRKIAASNSNVLITGETGTGKELAALAIHRLSARNQKPFICVNCAAIPDSLFESELFGYERGAFTGAYVRKSGWLETAQEGSVFLDEIGDLSPLAQAKLLRTIENKEFRRLGGKGNVCVNVRYIAATNCDLEEMASTGKFRQDLYYRLNIARVHLPPLRERKEDIPLLLQHYIDESNARNGGAVRECTEEVWNCLMNYNWPGNIRELKNLLEATMVNAPREKISFADLPELFRRRLEKAACDTRNEREQLLAALLGTKWNKSKAAEKLHWSRMTLYRKMAKYRLSTPH